ncbi:MAG: methionine--tRNA ligase [Alphaproteobacteria bacterium]|nr:methionine--tRNA ligase [Alphaproteobacteria bacterium]
MSPTYYLTTPIYYVNDKPHIGHAYTTLACDVLARFKRLDGYNVMFLTGTDEHGQKVQDAAEKAGVAPQSFTDTVSQNFRDLTSAMNFSNDQFIRTTEPRHYESCRHIWNMLLEKGHIRLDKYAGWYSVRDEAFFTETELVDGKAPTGAPVEWVEEPSYFFALSEWQQPLLDYYEAHPDFIAPAGRLNEIRSFVKGGLKDLSISRTTFDWGVPVPNDNDHVMYVWLDALTNYLTALDWQNDGADYSTYWPCDLHMVGKDILRFHAVYWPAFLMASGLPLPKRIFAHGWWTNEGEKISKSIGNVIDPLALIDKYGLDQTRYFLLREVPFGRDGDFSETAMIARINSDLANDLGNLSQRTLSLVVKNCDGIMPALPADISGDDADLLAAADGLLEKVRAEFDQQAFHEGLRLIWDVIAAANRYIDTQAPWALKKTDINRMGEVLAIIVETIRQIAILVQPVMPQSAAKLLDQLMVPDDARGFEYIAGRARLTSGIAIKKPQGVFPRYQEPEGEGA